MHRTDIAVIALYLAALTTVGVCVRGRQKTLTVHGGKLLNLHAYNYPWNEYTIGAIGNVVLMAAGLLVTMVLPANANRPSRNTLWDWLADRRRTRIFAIQVGETS